MTTLTYVNLDYDYCDLSQLKIMTTVTYANLDYDYCDFCQLGL